MNEARELLRIARSLVSDDVPGWVATDFVRSIQLSGTGLKAYGASLGGVKMWMLKSKRKIYKDNYGWITAQWYVHPELQGNKWVIKSVLGFSPATSGSFANEKIEEFKGSIHISGKLEKGMMGWEDYVLTAEPRGDGDGEAGVKKLIGTHLKDLKEAKRFWKKALSDAKRMMIASRIDGPTSLDGMTNVTARRNVNKLLGRYSKGLFHDSGWHGVDMIWKAMDAGAINWELTGTRYYKNERGIPNSKEWKFEVYFWNKKERFTTFHGVVTAMGAGSVDDILSRYDLAAYVS